MTDLLQTRWTAKAVCENCNTTAFLHYPIPEDRTIGLHRCRCCNEPQRYYSTDTTEFGMLIWSQLTNSLTFYDSDEPVVEITLTGEPC